MNEAFVWRVRKRDSQMSLIESLQLEPWLHHIILSVICSLYKFSSVKFVRISCRCNLTEVLLAHQGRVGAPLDCWNRPPKECRHLCDVDQFPAENRVGAFVRPAGYTMNDHSYVWNKFRSTALVECTASGSSEHRKRSAVYVRKIVWQTRHMLKATTPRA